MAKQRSEGVVRTKYIIAAQIKYNKKSATIHTWLEGGGEMSQRIADQDEAEEVFRSIERDMKKEAGSAS